MEEQKIIKAKFDYVGFVDDVMTKNTYGQTFVCRDRREVPTDAKEAARMQLVVFEVSSKKTDLMEVSDSLYPGDKIAVKFVPWCSRGTNRNTGKNYCIAKNYVQSIDFIEKAPRAANMPEAPLPRNAEGVADVKVGNDEDLPF